MGDLFYAGSQLYAIFYATGVQLFQNESIPLIFIDCEQSR